MCSIAWVPGVSLLALSLSPFQYWSKTSSSILQWGWTPYRNDWTWPCLLVCVLWVTSFRKVLHLNKSRKRSSRKPPDKEIGGPWVRAWEQQKVRLHVTCYFHEKSQHTSNSNRAKKRSTLSCPFEWKALSEKLHGQKATFVKLYLSSGPSLDEPLYTQFPLFASIP